MFRTILLLGCSLSARAESGEIRPQTEVRWNLGQVVIPSDIFSAKGPLHQHRAARSASVSDVGDCVLLLGSFCNGYLGDVAQARAWEHALASVLPGQCFWYAHPSDEDLVRGNRIGEFFGGDMSRLISLTNDDAWKVNRFKALIIGGGGILSTQHLGLNLDEIAEGLTLPIVIIGVGESRMVKTKSVLLEKAYFVSGRDVSSMNSFSELLRRGERPVVQPEDVALVRDPVLSDNTLTDAKGTCWKQSEGEYLQPLCFVLPTWSTESAKMHRHLVEQIVRPEDVFVNVFPKYQTEIEQHGYPGEVLQILDPLDFTQRMCSCRAIVSTSFHGIVLGLHMGVPVFGAYLPSDDHSVLDLMIGTLHLPEQLFVVDKHLTREMVDLEVQAVRGVYANRNRRASIHERLAAFSDDFRSDVHHVLFDVISEWQQQRVGERAPKETKLKELTALSRGGSRQYQGAAEVEPVATLGTVFETAGEAKELTEEKNAPSIAEALMSRGSRADSPADAKSGTGTDVQKKENQHSPAEAERSAPSTSATKLADAIRGNVPPPQPSPGEEAMAINDAIGSAVLIDEAYMAAATIVVAIIALAILPSGGSPRSPLNGSPLLPAKGPVRGDALAPYAVQREISCSCASSDSEVGVPERPSSGRLARSTRATGVAATSSKMIFMLNFTMWVFLAVGFVGHGRAYLGDTHDPVGLLVLQGATGVMVLGLLGRFGVLDLHRGKDLTPAAAQQAGLAAFLHTGQALLTNFALLLGGITITNALKGLEPVAAAAFSYVLLGKPCSGPRMAALATLLGGIVLMMFEGGGSDTDGEERADGGTESGYLLTSIFMVLAAVCCNALRNVVIKMGNPTPPHQTLLSCSAAATMVGLVLVLLRFVVRSTDDLLERGASDLATVDGGDTGTAGRHDLTTSWLRMDGVNAALCFVGYNLASFNLLARLSPVGHAVGDSCKRMVVFASGPLFLGEVMSVRQLGGMAVALFGVLAYNVVGGY